MFRADSSAHLEYSFAIGSEAKVEVVHSVLLQSSNEVSKTGVLQIRLHSTHRFVVELVKLLTYGGCATDSWDEETGRLCRIRSVEGV